MNIMNILGACTFLSHQIKFPPVEFALIAENQLVGYFFAVKKWSLNFLMWFIFISCIIAFQMVDDECAQLQNLQLILYLKRIQPDKKAPI